MSSVVGWDLYLNPNPVVRYEPPALVCWDEPYLPIAERETYVPVPPSGCPGRCFYGECGAPGTYSGCGGCCGCCGGCQLTYEQQQIAPIVWTGDPA